MRRRSLEAVLIAGAVALAPSLAAAQNGHPDPYEIRLYRLGTAADVATLKPGSVVAFDASNDNFRAFARQLAAAMTSANLSPPETLGHSGFSVTAELSIIDFNAAQSGPLARPLPTQGEFKGPLLLPSIHFRKGLPASFEVGARAAWIEQSRMGIATVELKWALNEGFTYLPDIGVRGHLSKLVNGRDFDLTAGGVDLGIGKQFAIGGMITLTPYAGWNLVFVGATSGEVDFTPTRSLAQSDTAGLGAAGGLFGFEPVQAINNSHNRFYVGFRFIGGLFQLGGEFSYSVIGRFQNEKTKAFTDVPAVLGWNSTLGLDF